MAYVAKENTGSIFKNEKKEKDTHPDRTGSLNVEGVDYWVSGWVKEKDGKQYLSIAIKRKEAKAPYKVEPPAQHPRDLRDDFGDAPF